MRRTTRQAQGGGGRPRGWRRGGRAEKLQTGASGQTPPTPRHGDLSPEGPSSDLRPPEMMRLVSWSLQNHVFVIVLQQLSKRTRWITDHRLSGAELTRPHARPNVDPCQGAEGGAGTSASVASSVKGTPWR